MRTFLLVLLLPALFFGQALGGMAAWVHSHGSSGAHLHLVADRIDDDLLGSLHERFDAQHRHEHEDDAREEEEPAPTGMPIELPELLAAPCKGPRLASAQGLHVPALLATPRWPLVLHVRAPAHERGRSGSPPRGAERSGIAALLRSSHAIRI